MKRAFIVFFVACLLGCGPSRPPITGPQWKDDGCRDWVYDASGGVTWDLNGDEDGIETFTGSVAGSDFFAFRGAGAVDAPIAKVANVLIDTTRHPEWVPNFGGIRILEDVSKEEKVIYRHVLTPAVIDDRDFVLKVHVHTDEESGHLLVDIKSTKHPKAPPTEDKVRGVIHKNSGYRLWPIDGGRRTMVVFTIHVDPRGDVPAWIVNTFQDGHPRNTIKNIRAQAAKADVTDHPEVKQAFLAFEPKCGNEASGAKTADGKATKKPSAAKSPDGEPADAEAKPAAAEAKPTDAEAKPTDPEAKPADADAKPSEADAKPADADAKPADADAKPSDAKPSG